ncbi:hypothetical protein ACI2JA_19700 [Alkalihalobacillus sp. NPDC078783]
MNNKVRLMMDNWAFTKKPTGDDVKGIQARIVNKEVEIPVSQLARSLSNGYTIGAGVLKKGSKKNHKDNYKRQEIVMLDFDSGEFTIDQAKADPFLQANAAFMYLTFSHMPDKHRFRVVMILDKPCYDIEQYKQFYENIIMNRYSVKNDKGEVVRYLIDKKGAEGTRLFYGGHSQHMFNYSNRLKLDRGVLSDPEEGTSIYIGHPKPPKQLNQESNITLIKNRNINALIEAIDTEPHQVHTVEEARNYIKQQDLAHYLGFEHYNLLDIFHNEDSPSASIYKANTGTGHWLYKCHSESHEFVGNIMTVTERLLNCSALQARQFLQEVYQVEILESDLQKQVKEEIEEFKALLRSDDLETMYPNFYKLMSKNGYLQEFYVLLDIFKEFVPSDIGNYGDEEFRLLMHYSMGTLSKRFNKGLTTTKQRMGFFTFFRMIYKLPESEVPPNLLAIQKARQEKTRVKYINSTYQLPLHGYQFFTELDVACKDWMDRGMTNKSINRDGILRNYGESEANRVFPQTSKEKIPEMNDEIVSYLEETGLHAIHNKGWTTQNEMIEKTKLYFRGQHNYKVNMIKNCIGAFLEKYDLRFIQCSKAIKEKYKITEDQLNGFPKLIVPNN